MDPTIINSPDPDRALVQAEGTRGVDAYRRAPTLMAGDAPGGQGSVFVWAPETREFVRLMVLSPLLLGVLTFVMLIVLPMGAGRWALTAAIAVAFTSGIAAMCAVVLPASLRRRYFTTDDAGIGLTTWRGTRACRWDEVVAFADSSPRGSGVLYLDCGESINLNLNGYPASTLAGLRTVVVHRAGLAEVLWARVPPYALYARPGTRINGFRRVARIRIRGLAPDPSVLPQPTTDGRADQDKAVEGDRQGR